MLGARGWPAVLARIRCTSVTLESRATTTTSPARPASSPAAAPPKVRSRLAFQNHGWAGTFSSCRLRKAIAAAPSSASFDFAEPSQPGASRPQGLISAAGHHGGLSAEEPVVHAAERRAWPTPDCSQHAMNLAPRHESR
jgi:hypothetical protein